MGPVNGSRFVFPAFAELRLSFLPPALQTLMGGWGYLERQGTTTKQAKAKLPSWGSPLSGGLVPGGPSFNTFLSVFVLLFVFKYQRVGSMGLCSWPGQVQQATFLFSIPKVTLLRPSLCCCQRALDRARSSGLAPWAAHRDCRRKCGHVGIIITANMDEALSSCQASFQTLYNILRFTVS